LDSRSTFPNPPRRSSNASLRFGDDADDAATDAKTSSYLVLADELLSPGTPSKMSSSYTGLS
jgi:hypothetical protein